jgi:hypothetical protein
VVVFFLFEFPKVALNFSINASKLVSNLQINALIVLLEFFELLSTLRVARRCLQKNEKKKKKKKKLNSSLGPYFG